MAFTCALDSPLSRKTHVQRHVNLLKGNLFKPADDAGSPREATASAHAHFETRL